MGKIALYTFFGDNFFEYGFTMLYSFLTNNQWFKGDIYILSDNGENCSLSDEKIKILQKLYSKISRYQVNIDEYKGIFSNLSNMNRKEFRASFYKFEMFKKDEYDFKYYIDADTCFNGSVEGLFSEEAKKYPVFMCKDNVSSDYFSEELTEKTDEDYANLGFLLLNGAFLHDDDFSKLVDRCEKIKPGTFKNRHTFNGVCGDQDCINEFVKDAVLLPALVYDGFTGRITTENIDKVKTFHFYGNGLKPWDCRTEYPAFFVWYRYYFLAMQKLKEITA